MTDSIVLRITGRAPLLMRNGRLADPLDEASVALARVTAKRAKTAADYHRISAIEWRASLWLSGSRPCLPGEAIEAAVVAAGRTRRMGAVARAAVVVPDDPILEHDGPTDLDELFRDKRFVHRTGVKVGGRMTMRTRVMFPRWSASVTLEFLPSMIDGDVLCDLMTIAGDRIGVGDFRPRYGRFAVAP
jgi:hypothetical protein